MGSVHGQFLLWLTWNLSQLVSLTFFPLCPQSSSAQTSTSDFQERVLSIHPVLFLYKDGNLLCTGAFGLKIVNAKRNTETKDSIGWVEHWGHWGGSWCLWLSTNISLYFALCVLLSCLRNQPWTVALESLKLMTLFIPTWKFCHCLPSCHFKPVCYFFFHNNFKDKFKEIKETCLQHQMSEFLLSCDQISWCQTISTIRGIFDLRAAYWVAWIIWFQRDQWCTFLSVQNNFRRLGGKKNI